MRTFKTVFMRGGTSKGCMVHKEELPEQINSNSEVSALLEKIRGTAAR